MESGGTMRIVNVNEGRYADFRLDGRYLTIGGNLTIDLAQEQRGYDVTLDVCSDSDGKLAVGQGIRYVCQIFIPGRVYAIHETGDADEMGFRQIEKTAQSLDTDKVVLYLWSMEE